MMRDLKLEEAEQVGGGMPILGGTFTYGLGVSAVAGSVLGPPGVAVAVVTYSAVYAAASFFEN